MNKLTRLSIFMVLWMALWYAHRVEAQSSHELQLRMGRTFGYASGTGRIQGIFTLKVSGPAELQRVIFYLDDQVLGEVTQPPFELSFNTDDHSFGEHRLYAVGFTTSARELSSNEIQVMFVSAEEGWQAGMRILVPLLVFVFAAIALSFGLSLLAGNSLKTLPPGAPRRYGLSGGTICPGCQRPFVRHFLSPNLITGKLERCPFCGKWSIAPRYPLEELRAAEAAELKAAQPGAAIRSEEEQLRQAIEESRYHDL